MDQNQPAEVCMSADKVGQAFFCFSIKARANQESRRSLLSMPIHQLRKNKLFPLPQPEHQQKQLLCPPTAKQTSLLLSESIGQVLMATDRSRSYVGSMTMQGLSIINVAGCDLAVESLLHGYTGFCVELGMRRVGLKIQVLLSDVSAGQRTS